MSKDYELTAKEITNKEAGELITKGAFGMTIEQAREQIGYTLQMYELAKEVIARLIKPNDVYYMSTISNPENKPKDGEPRVFKKQAVDKLLGFFKIKVFPTEEKIDGGYKVTAVGEDSNGGYIATGVGTCTKYEKKYSWVKADDEEYAAANEEDRREIQRKGKYGKYKSKQIKTDERAIAHTLISMATKRARAAFLRMAFPGLDDVMFEGEGEESDFQYDDTKQTDDNTIMSESDISKFYKRLTKKGSYTKEEVSESMLSVLKRDKFGKLTIGESKVIESYLRAQKNEELDKAAAQEEQGDLYDQA
jgi:hypothetical protein